MFSISNLFLFGSFISRIVLLFGGVSSNGFDATIVSPNVLIGGGGARSGGGIPTGGVLF